MVDLLTETQLLLKTLFPICRSITGDGVRQTLGLLQQTVAFNMYEIPSGTVCYDWVVPDEWNVKDAYIANMDGKKLIDFKESNIHLVSYSIGVDQVMSFAELRQHLHSLPNLPQAIPYRTSYYKRDWGFCLSHDQLMQFDQNASYRVFIGSTLTSGSMTLGDAVVRGETNREFLFSTYCCHPSLANDSLSGVVLWTLLLRELRSKNFLHNSYRFVILPETIGAIAYLSQHEEEMKHLMGGFVLTTVAGPGRFGYKKSFLGNHLIDRATYLTFRDAKVDFISYPFDIKGSDETHYSAPYFRVPIGTITKDKYYEYPYYHTSLDDLNFVQAEYLIETLQIYLSLIENLENDAKYRSLNPYCEPMLGKRGLYPSLGGQINQPALSVQYNHAADSYMSAEGNSIKSSELDAFLWLMFYADGEMSLLEIADKTNLPVQLLHNAAQKLCKHGLLETIDNVRMFK
jgi:aminopeptidase-like protein